MFTGPGNTGPCPVMLYVGEGPRRSNGACSSLCWISVTSPLPTIKLGPSGAGSRVGGWACACSRPLWVSPTNSPVRLGVSPAAALTPTGVFNQRFEALFPCAGALGCMVCFSPRCCSRFICAQMWGHRGCQTPPCHESSPPWQPISASPTGLDECFFFISLVDRLPYSSVFHQFWLFFVFKLLLSFWLYEEAQCVYLHLHLGWRPHS